MRAGVSKFFGNGGIGMEIERITGTDVFEKAVAKGDAVVAFGAPWCGYCRKLEPVMAKAAAEEETLAFYGMNVDADKELAERFRIDTVPTVIYFKGGEPKDSFVGFVSYSDLKDFLAKNK